MTKFDYCIAIVELLLVIELFGIVVRWCVKNDETVREFSSDHGIVFGFLGCFSLACIAMVDLIVGASLPVSLITVLYIGSVEAVAFAMIVTGKFPTPGLWLVRACRH